MYLAADKVAWKNAPITSPPSGECNKNLLSRHQWLISVILTMWENKIRRIGVPVQEKKKFVRPHVNVENLSIVACACHPSDNRKSKIGGSKLKPAWAKSETPISKITRAKRTGGVAQVVECKCKALSQT
jgi:hypothetical protein